MIRSGHYWLSILPEDIREKFLNNFDVYFGYKDVKSLDEYLNRFFIFSSFIACAFRWDKSLDGYEYWDLISIANNDIIKSWVRDKKIKDILENE